VFGGLSTYLNKGDLQVTVSYRGYESTKHFQGKKPFPELDANGPINRQHQLNFDFTYAFSQKLNLSLNVPVHVNSFSVRRAAPGNPVPFFQKTESKGVGDISVRARYWLLSTERSDRNIGVSVGLKMPTGKANREDQIVGRVVPVDISVQTGDKGWGMTAGVQGFQRIKRVNIYGAASYLFNPRNTTGVPTFFGSLTNARNTTVNSVPDQFSAQIGTSVHIKRKWPLPTIAYRVEGAPVTDVFGKSDGFRRPGTFGFVEPGVSYGIGKHLFSFNVAIRNYVHVKDAPNSVRIEDATIPKYMFFVAYSKRF
jgi:hypothetical protein